MNIYIACGLTHVPRETFQSHVSFIHALAHALESQGFHVKYALKDSDPQLAEKPFEDRARLCYLWDREMVEYADVVVAEASYPSTGQGIELQIAENRGIPIIICFNRGHEYQAAPVEYENPNKSNHLLQIGEGYVSLMALGIPTIFKLIGYNTAEEGIDSVVSVVTLLDKSYHTLSSPTLA